MGEDITEEVRKRLEVDSEPDADTDGDSEPLFTIDRPDNEDEGGEADE